MGDVEKKLQKSYFDVLGLCCSSEVPLIEKILKSLDGVKDVTVVVPTRTVIVVHDSLLISQLQIVKALNQARLEANIRAGGYKNYQKKWPSPYAVACGLLLLLSFLKYFCPPLKWLAIGAVAVGILPIILKAVAAVRICSLDINILMLIAVVGSIALEDYWEAGTIVFLFTTAQWLESRASHKATAAMSSLVNVVPQRAVIAETNEEVNADEVKLNTILAVKAGETIPIDGIVVEGNCEADEKTLTGESFPVAKQKDSIVWAGTINLNGYISVKTTAVSEDCVVAKMAKLVEDAQNNKSRTQRFIDKCAKYYTPAVITISASFAIVPAALRLENQKHWYHLALVILVTACPCALIISAPVAMFCALSKAATSGLLFKGAEYLETLAKIHIMAFDKTGTITRGEFVVTDFKSLLDDVSFNTLLYWVSSIESKSSHPMAAALVDYTQWHSVVPEPDKVEQFQNFPGEGIYGKIDGKDIYVGNAKISLRAGCRTVPNIEADSTEGKSIGFIFSGSSLAGFFSLSDVCRTGVKDALEELKLMGINTAMLTGDSYASANYAQSQLGGALDVVHAELLPEDKARIIQQFQKEAPTAMIGDGINDAPALATADIGISMGISGSALATETGNVILMSNDIRRIPKAVRLAKRVRRKVIENVILSISTKAIIVALAIAGHPLVWAAVLADVGTCLLVIFNSMLLLRGTHRHEKKCCKTSADSHVNKDKCKTTSHKSSHSHKGCCPEIGTPEKTDSCAASCHEKECSKTSTSSHVHKHNCKTTSHQSSHSHKACCSEIGTPEKTDSCVASCHESKCSKASAASHVHNNKCTTTSCQSLHVHQACCPEIGTPEQTDTCAATCHFEASSSESCGEKTCSESTNKHDFHLDTNQICESEEDNHASCKTIQASGSCGGDDHCCLDQLVENKCSMSVKSPSGCGADGEIHDAEHCHHINHNAEADDNSTTSNKSCQVSCCKDNSNPEPIAEETGNPVKSCCKDKPRNQEVLSGCKNHDKCGAPMRSTINILIGNNHVNCSAVRTCSTLEKRQVRGCCRKECCPKSSHLGASFRASLSEIVIE